MMNEPPYQYLLATALNVSNSTCQMTEIEKFALMPVEPSPIVGRCRRRVLWNIVAFGGRRRGKWSLVSWQALRKGLCLEEVDEEVVGRGRAKSLRGTRFWWPKA